MKQDHNSPLTVTAGQIIATINVTQDEENLEKTESKE